MGLRLVLSEPCRFHLAFSASYFKLCLVLFVSFQLCPSGCSRVSVATLAFGIFHKRLLAGEVGRVDLPVCEAQALPRGPLAAKGGPACSVEDLEWYLASLNPVLI